MMLFFLNKFSKIRTYWILLILSVFFIIGVTLLIQNFFYLKPCVLCVYQRCALFGISTAGLITLIAPNITILRFLGIIIWIYSALKGLFLAQKNINIILHPDPFSTCDLFVNFPHWLPLHKWWPNMFNPNGGNCLDYTWYFLSFEISQWTFLIFTSYLILAFYTICAQFIYLKK